MLKEIRWRKSPTVELVLERDRRGLVPLLRWVGLDHVPVGREVAGMAFDGTSIWVAHDEHLSRIGLESRAVEAKVKVGRGPSRVLFDGVHLWVACTKSNAVVRVDPAKAAVAGVVRNLDAPVGMAFDGTALWVGGAKAGVVRRIDPRTDEVDGEVGGKFGGWISDLAFDGRHVWVGSADPGTEELAKFDPVAGKVAGSIRVGHPQAGLAFDGTHLWASLAGEEAAARGGVVKVHATLMKVDGVVAVGSDPRGLVFDGTHLWAACRGGNQLSRINPDVILHEKKGRPLLDRVDEPLLATVGLGPCPTQIAFDGTHVWAAVEGRGTVCRIPVWN